MGCKNQGVLGFMILCVIMLLACGGGDGGGVTGREGQDDQGADTVVSMNCDGDKPDPGCLEDADGDGLLYLEETQGWEVWPDSFGLGLGVDTFGQMDAHYAVTSDIGKADTDGDGLTDYQEFLIKSDPRKIDTDGDGLTDEEEFNRWHTSPLSVDSDNDCRGPDKDLPPNANLFDSAELKIDLTGDPTHTPGLGATSPVLADTDGDGYSDYYEIIETRGSGFSPVLADLPGIAINIASSPVIRLTGATESGVSWSKELSMTDTLSQSIAREAGTSRSTEFAIGNTTEIGAEIGFEMGMEGTDAVAKVTGSASMSYSVSTGMTTSDAISWSQSSARTAESAYQESMGEGGHEAVTLDGGYVAVNVDITNTGSLAYTLTNLRVSVLARYINGTSDYAAVLELSRDDNTPVSLAPGDTRTSILLRSSTADYELIRSFLKNPGGLMFEVADYDLTDEDGNSYVFDTETIKQRTAMVVIDYGGEAASERYLVATSPHRRDDALDGVSLPDILAGILGIAYTTEEATSEAGAYHVISSVTPRGGGTPVSNDPGHNKKWLVAIAADLADPDRPDIGSLLLKAGDAVHLMYMKDADHDLLSAREEALNGTTDMNADTDGDGLGDFEEIRMGWTVNIDDQIPYTARSRGFAEDFDADNIDDIDEKACGLDPVRIDTDQDGISDLDEISGYTIVDAGGETVLHVPAYAGTVILDGGDGMISTTPAGDDMAEATGEITPGAVLVSSGPNAVIDTTPAGDDYIAVTHDALPGDCFGGIYATSPLAADTDGDTVSDGSELAIALGSPNNPDDFDKYIDEDGDGLSNAVENTGFRSLVNGSWRTFTSDEATADTDADGLPDLLEYMLKSNPRSNDTDGDGLSDLDEYDFQTGWSEFEVKCAAATACSPPAAQGAMHGTLLTHRDTDSDGLNDKQELDGWNVTVFQRTPYRVTSDPLNANSDTDGWNDADERWHGTDPENADTDNDGTIDNIEPTISSSSWSWNVPASQRDPLTPDMRVTVAYRRINVGSSRCNVFSSTVWYYFWLDVVRPDGETVYLQRANDYCADRNCDHVGFQVSLDLTTEPKSHSFIMKRNGEVFFLTGLVNNITTHGDPACWFAGGNCATASWEYEREFTSETMSLLTSGTTETISGGGSSCLGDDTIEVRIDVD